MQNLFVYDANEPRSVTAEKQIRCVAFLLNSCTELGNRELDGNVARGLSEILNRSADRLGPMLSPRELVGAAVNAAEIVPLITVRKSMARSKEKSRSSARPKN